MQSEKASEIEHIESRSNPMTGNPRGETWSFCSCGARWSHPKSRPSETMDEIFLAHKSYFNRPPTVIL